MYCVLLVILLSINVLSLQRRDPKQLFTSDKPQSINCKQLPPETKPIPKECTDYVWNNYGCTTQNGYKYLTNFKQLNWQSFKLFVYQFDKLKPNYKTLKILCNGIAGVYSNASNTIYDCSKLLEYQTLYQMSLKQSFCIEKGQIYKFPSNSDHIIGSGGFGIVRKGMHFTISFRDNKLGVFVLDIVVKISQLDCDNIENRRAFTQEVIALRKLSDCEYIPEYITSSFFEGKKKKCIGFIYSKYIQNSQDLADFITTDYLTLNPTLTDGIWILLKMLVEVSNALEIMDRRNIIHSDIKAENILIQLIRPKPNEFDVNFFIIDFGTSWIKNTNFKDSMITGTYTTMSPEGYQLMIKNGEEESLDDYIINHSQCVDMYSLDVEFLKFVGKICLLHQYQRITNLDEEIETLCNIGLSFRNFAVEATMNFKNLWLKRSDLMEKYLSLVDNKSITGQLLNLLSNSIIRYNSSKLNYPQKTCIRWKDYKAMLTKVYSQYTTKY